MTTSYTYDQDDFTNAANVNLDQFQQAIKAQFPGIQYINMSQDGTNFTLETVFDEALSVPDKAILDGIVTNYEYIEEYDSICILKDVKSVGTNGGTFTKNAWRTRDLNHLEGIVDFLTLDNNQFTLTEGKYSITARAPAFDVRNHQTRLFNITDDTEIIGSCSYSWKGSSSMSEISAVIEINAPKIFEVQHICSETGTNTGFGLSSGFDTEEIYTRVTIQKL